MTPDENLLDLKQREAIVPKRFDLRSATPFVNKSVSEETRRAYRRAVADFFQFIGSKHPTEVVPADVLGWRDHLRRSRKKAATVSFKLSVIRSFFEYLKAGGIVALNPASTKLVTPPELPTEPAGRALSSKLDIYYWGQVVRSLKGEVWPLPKDVKQAIDEYLKLDAERRATLHNDEDAYLFQPHSNYRTLVFDKALSTRMVQNIVAKWGSFTGVGDVSPHDLRRTAITRALEMGQTYRQVQMMTKHRDPKTVMRYDHGRENLEQNAVNFLRYEEQ